MKIAIVVLNYNGKDLLQKYLALFQKAAETSKYSCRLIVLDNQSTDGSAEFVRAQFPSVQLHVAAENKVLCSYNELAAKVDEDILILMNNDIRVDAHFVDPLIQPFLDDDTVFFSTSKCLSMEGNRYEGNKTHGMIRYGVFWSSAIYPGYEKRVDVPGHTLQGGFGAFDRKKFLALKGYDDLYLPGRLEDADLCFRAYKRGWRCVYEPASVVYHEGGTSFHKVFGSKKTLEINWRNTFLFMWKNFGDTSSWAAFFIWIPARLFHALLTGRMEFVRGFFMAFGRLGDALRRRARLRQDGFLNSISDKTILSLRD